MTGRRKSVVNVFILSVLTHYYDDCATKIWDYVGVRGEVLAK